MSELLAGAATADVTPPAGVMLDGYGNRTQPSTGVHDELMARVLVLSQGEETAAIVSLDLLGMHPWITSQVRARAADLGIRADSVLVAATHDHAAPVGLRAGMFAHLDEPLAEKLVGSVGDALARAWTARRPATLGVATAHIETVSLNRRDPAGPIDPELLVVLVDSAEGAVATLVNFACHATILDGTNLQISGEFPGAAGRLVQRETGAPCVYLNGACGDVNPAWTAQDFAGVERAGRIIGGEVVRLAAEMRALGSGQRSHNIRWDEFLPVAPLGRSVQPSLRAARREVEVLRREFEDDDVYASRVKEAREAVANAEDTSERRAGAALVSRFEAERWSAVWARREPAPGRTEVQAIRLGEGLALVGLPGEFFAETGGAIRSASGLTDLIVAGYANDYMGYIVPAHVFPEGGYEPGLTFYGAEADAKIRETAADILRDVNCG